MQAFVNSWAVAVSMAIIFGAIISMLLPESGIKKYVSVVIGIVVTIFILSPVITLLSSFDIENELQDSLKKAAGGEMMVPQAGSYKDYIYQVYEVYMRDE
jgi:stage III sporulation protein AF